MTAPLSITDFLQHELDKAVGARSCDAERLRFLAIEQGNWSLRFREFVREARQPFGGPHPEYGPMQATDFVIVIGAITSAQSVVKARMEARNGRH